MRAQPPEPRAKLTCAVATVLTCRVNNIGTDGALQTCHSIDG
jgi:hypothetical protein